MFTLQVKDSNTLDLIEEATKVKVDDLQSSLRAMVSGDQMQMDDITECVNNINDLNSFIEQINVKKSFGSTTNSSDTSE